MKRRLVGFMQKRFINPYTRRRAGDPGFRYALLETTGRRSGLPRQTPVGNGAQGDTFWLVAENRDNAYVRNIEANPSVRVRYEGRWRTGTAHVIPDDDPQKRLDAAYEARTAGEVRRFGTSPTTVRIDLDPTS
jgi:deazaflavin-dependent oxidoreductase (nitroreductase family)